MAPLHVPLNKVEGQLGGWNLAQIWLEVHSHHPTDPFVTLVIHLVVAVKGIE